VISKNNIITNTLITSGVNPNIQDISGYSPLDYGAYIYFLIFYKRFINLIRFFK
jgi:hypothetical protein